MTPDVQLAFDLLHEFLFTNVYLGSKAKVEESKAQGIIEMLYKYFTANYSQIPSDYAMILKDEGPERAACDYVASMTDRFATDTFTKLFVPGSWDIK